MSRQQWNFLDSPCIICTFLSKLLVMQEVSGIGSNWWLEDTMEGSLNSQIWLTSVMMKLLSNDPLFSQEALKRYIESKKTNKQKKKKQEGNSSHMCHMQLNLWRTKSMNQVEITVLSEEDMIWIITGSFTIWNWRKETKPWAERNYAIATTHLWLLNTIQRAGKDKVSVRSAT